MIQSRLQESLYSNKREKTGREETGRNVNIYTPAKGEAPTLLLQSRSLQQVDKQHLLKATHFSTLSIINTGCSLSITLFNPGQSTYIMWFQTA